MQTFTITYRKSNGNTDQAAITAASESEAKAAFMARYDGRIITVESKKG